ncbi:hypothetical protein LCGC14_1504910 [marine sediment metagenome]|uniref:Uncharacterized protein n=1 Tax=marine sediment metagenome TaxID=412755 RepID=A0A0F9JNR8_9ZZZZ
MPTTNLMSMDVIGLREMTGRFGKMAGNQGLRKIHREELRNLGRKAVGILRKEASMRTGDLRKGMGFKTFDRRTTTELKLTSKMFYTKWVLDGRRGFSVKNAQALRFEPGPPGSGFIFRKSVGPAKANPFLDRTMSKLSGMGEPRKTAGTIGARLGRIFTRGS